MKENEDKEIEDEGWVLGKSNGSKLGRAKDIIWSNCTSFWKSVERSRCFVSFSSFVVLLGLCVGFTLDGMWGSSEVLFIKKSYFYSVMI